MAEYENVADELDAMINNSHEDDLVEGENAIDEDTDQTEELDDGTETNDEDADLDQDTDEVDDLEDEENALVDNDSLEDTDVDEEDELDESEDGDDELTESDTAVTEDSTEPEVESDGTDTETTETIDYQKQYEELLSKSEEANAFYEQVAGVKFKANGKEFEGFKDPKKIIQAQQMAYNYSEKMAGFKQYKPYIGPLKERGMLEDPEKFDLAMSLIDGDKEALKQHIANLGVDPLDLDMEDIQYAGEVQRTSRSTLAVEDALELAKDNGVEDQVYQAVIKEWDDESFQDFVKDPKIQTDLVAQMADGSYDIVNARIMQKSVLDTNFASMKMVDKYRVTVQDLRAEYQKEVDIYNAQQEQIAPIVEEKPEPVVVETKVDQVAYAAKVKENEVAEAARKKAARASKPRRKTTTKKRIEDPMNYNGNEIASFLDDMIMGKK